MTMTHWLVILLLVLFAAPGLRMIGSAVFDWFDSHDRDDD